MNNPAVAQSHPLCRIHLTNTRPHQRHTYTVHDSLPSSIHVKAAGLEGEPSVRDTTAVGNIKQLVVGLKLMYWYQDWVWDWPGEFPTAAPWWCTGSPSPEGCREGWLHTGSLQSAGRRVNKVCYVCGRRSIEPYMYIDLLASSTQTHNLPPS